MIPKFDIPSEPKPEVHGDDQKLPSMEEFKGKIESMFSGASSGESHFILDNSTQSHILFQYLSDDGHIVFVKCEGEKILDVGSVPLPDLAKYH